VSKKTLYQLIVALTRCFGDCTRCAGEFFAGSAAVKSSVVFHVVAPVVKRYLTIVIHDVNSGKQTLTSSDWQEVDSGLSASAARHRGLH